MLALLSNAWAARRLIAIGLAAVAVLGLWLYVSHLQSRAERAEQEAARLSENLETATRVAVANAQAVEQAKQEAARTIAALERERDAMAERGERVRIIYKEIAHAPESDDGPVAPVLARTLDRLRDPAAQGGDRDPHRAAGGSDRAAHLQPEPDAPGR